MAKQEKTTKLPVKRVYELSDSLAQASQKPLNWKGGQKSVASQLKSQESNRLKSQLFKNRADEALKKAGDVPRDYRFDTKYNTKYTNPTAGRDTPLPSSDGIIGTITNKISELFK